MRTNNEIQSQSLSAAAKAPSRLFPQSVFGAIIGPLVDNYNLSKYCPEILVGQTGKLIAQFGRKSYYSDRERRQIQRLATEAVHSAESAEPLKYAQDLVKGVREEFFPEAVYQCQSAIRTLLYKFEIREIEDLLSISNGAFKCLGGLPNVEMPANQHLELLRDTLCFSEIGFLKMLAFVHHGKVVFWAGH